MQAALHICWLAQLAFSALVGEDLFVAILENHTFHLPDQSALAGKFRL